MIDVPVFKDELKAKKLEDEARAAKIAELKERRKEKQRDAEEKKAQIISFREQYEANYISAADIAKSVGVRIQFAQGVLYRAGIKKKQIKRSRVYSFIWFYEHRIYSVAQIARFVGRTVGSTREFMSTSGARRLTISAAVDKLVSDGVAFERALSMVNKSSDAYYRSMLEQARK
jgi:hypothetical protein